MEAQPRHSLSVEDIGSPNLMRTVGRVVEVFPDGTSQLELQRPPQGTFGFHVSSGNDRLDTGMLVLCRELFRILEKIDHGFTT